MRIEGFSTAAYHVNRNIKSNNSSESETNEEFTSNIGLERPKEPIQISQLSNDEALRDYAEYYFKAGKSYEKIQSYRQAISAYERSNVVNPAANAAHMVNNIRTMLFSQ